jgi:titin
VNGTPIHIAAKDANGAFVKPVVLRYVAFDNANNPSLAKIETYTFGAATAPGAPTGVKAAAGNTTADVSWTAPPAGGSPVTGYTVTATTGTGTTPVATAKALPTATTASLTGLTNGTTYTVSVVANSAAGDSAAGTATVTPAAVEVLTASAPTNKTGDFRVKGGSNAPSGSVSLFRTDTAGNQTGTVLATSPLTAAAAPATGSTFDLRARTTIAPGTKLIIVGSNGGKLTITA